MICDLKKTQYTGKLTDCVTVKLRYSDFNTFTKQAKASSLLMMVLLLDTP